MLVLALDSSAAASVCLATVEGTTVRVLASLATEDTRSHAEVMTPFAQQALEQAGIKATAIDAVLTGTGPGPFTGLRAGIVTARTLAFAWNKPLYGMMSLNALAEHVAPTARAQGHSQFLVATDARRKEIYSASYRLTETGYSLETGPRVGAAQQAPPLAAYGFGAGLYADQLENVAGFEGLQPHAQDLIGAAARAGFSTLSKDTSALYLRESDAKVPAARKKAGA